MINTSLQEVSQHPDYLVLKRVPTTLNEKIPLEQKQFIATIIDLETMGLNPKAHEIIELGLLSFSFSTEDGIMAVVDTYNEFNDPGKPIPLEVSKITNIFDKDVAGKSIDWEHVFTLLKKSHLIICHNSGFDRNFLELQTPDFISSQIQSMHFGCTLQDIDWKARNIESGKLDYINFKLGFFYVGHRAINDCWATLNVLVQAPGTFDELKSNVRRKDTLICAVNAAFDKKDLLKARHYRWSDGGGSLPKSWWICLPSDSIEAEKLWLDETIYSSSSATEALPQIQINAKKRYSYRAERLD